MLPVAENNRSTTIGHLEDTSILARAEEVLVNGGILFGTDEKQADSQLLTSTRGILGALHPMCPIAWGSIG